MNPKFSLLFSVILALFVSACGTTPSFLTSSNHGPKTPCIQKHWKRGYNKPYKIKGERYTPQRYYNYDKTGVASYYGGTDVFHGRRTSTGEVFSMYGLTAAHKTLPLPCVVRVTNVENGRSIKLIVNDRGPFCKNRIIDVSRKAAKILGFYRKGTAKVNIQTCVDDSVRFAKQYRLNTQGKQIGNNPNVSSKVSTLKVGKKQASNTKKKKVSHSSDGVKSVKLNGIYVQAGTFNHLNDCNKLRRYLKLMLNMQQVKSVPVVVKQKQMYRVVLGPLKSSRAAEALIKRMRMGGHRDAIVVYE